MRRRYRIAGLTITPLVALAVLMTLLLGVAYAAINYPTSLDASFANDGDRSSAIIQLETKLGIGASPASSASTGQVLTKQAGGTTSWATPAGGGAMDPWLYMNSYASPAAAVSAATAGDVIVVDQRYTLSSALVINKALTLLCEGNVGAGFNTTLTGASIQVQASDVTIRGCAVDGNYPTGTTTEGIQVENGSQRVMLDQLRITDLVLGVGILDGDYVTVQHSTFDNLKNSAVRSHDPGSTKANEHLLVAYNQIRNFQRGGAAGNAAIQTAGPTTEARQLEHQFIGNDIDAVTSNGGTSMVALGLDQCSYCLVQGNIYRGAGFSEGIAISGHDNRILDNQIDHRTLSAASCILLWSQGGELAVKDTVVSGNVLSFCAQGVAVVSGSGSPQISDVTITGGRVRNSTYGVQSYSNGSTFDGNRMLIHGMNVAGNTNGCVLEDAAAFTLADNLGSC